MLINSGASLPDALTFSNSGRASVEVRGFSIGLDPDSLRESSFMSTLVSFEQRPRDDFGYTIRYHGIFTDRSFFEPVVELVQHKSASECRYDRLLGRGTDTEETIAKRLAIAEQELEAIEFFDYAVVNDDLDTAVGSVLDVIEAERIGQTAEVRERYARSAVFKAWRRATDPEREAP